MALAAEILTSLDTFKKAEYALDKLVNDIYERGTRVSFRKFTYYGVQDVPVLTGTVMWANLKTGSTKHIYVGILLDDEFIPCEWIHAKGDQTIVTIDVLEPEYDITIIGKNEKFA
jgi:hypothetical protein